MQRHTPPFSLAPINVQRHQLPASGGPLHAGAQHRLASDIDGRALGSMSNDGNYPLGTPQMVDHSVRGRKLLPIILTSLEDTIRATE